MSRLVRFAVLSHWLPQPLQLALSLPMSSPQE